MKLDGGWSYKKQEKNKKQKKKKNPKKNREIMLWLYYHKSNECNWNEVGWHHHLYILLSDQIDTASWLAASEKRQKHKKKTHKLY